jgi:ATP-binding cassette subfamily B protein
MKKIFFLLNYGQKRKLLFIVFFLFFLGFIEILIFSTLQPIINYFTTNSLVSNNFISKIFFGQYFNIKILLIFFFLFFLFRSVLIIYISSLKANLVKKINDDFSSLIYLNYLNKNYEFFINNSSSDLISNIILEVEKFSYRVIDNIISGAAELFIILSVLGFLFYNYFQGTLFLSITIIILFSLFYSFYKKEIKKMGLEKSFYDKKKINNLQNSFHSIQNIKLDHNEGYFYKRFVSSTSSSSRSSFYIQLISDLPKPFIEFIVMIMVFFLLLIFYFFFNVSKQEIITMLGLFIVGMFRLLPSCNKIINSINNIRFNYSSVDLISGELLNSRNLTISNNSYNNFLFKDSIKFINVNFSYSSNKKTILKNINLTIKKNESIGIFGSSGSGKSTLLNIMCNLLAPTTGQILLDNKPLDQISSAYQKKIGYVSQKTTLIEGSIIENIIFGIEEKDYNYKLFDDAVKKSDLKSFLSELPDGKNTYIGEKGSRLSGGQQQRIGIARALYKDPEILILDEATSALDENSENEILNTIKNLKNKLTIVIVSHKKSIFIGCDKIYKLDSFGILQV